MIEQDTVKLLRECDAGIKMGVSSIDDVLGHVKSEKLKTCLDECKNEHDKLQTEVAENGYTKEVSVLMEERITNRRKMCTKE